MQLRYPWDGAEQPEVCLTLSHRKRMLTIALFTQQLDRALPGARLVVPTRPVPGANQPQPFYCYLGQLEEACLARSGPRLNGVLCIIKEGAVAAGGAVVDCTRGTVPRAPTSSAGQWRTPPS